MTQEDVTNPYLPPQAPVDMPEQRDTTEAAGKGRRFGTLLVDYACYMALSFCVGIAVALLFGQSGIETLNAIPNLVLGIGILTAYYTFFEGIWGRTPGKFVFGTVVVDEEGRKPPVGQVVVRTACRFIPFEAFSFLGKNRGLHDRISKTQVILTRR